MSSLTRPDSRSHASILVVGTPAVVPIVRPRLYGYCTAPTSTTAVTQPCTCAPSVATRQLDHGRSQLHEAELEGYASFGESGSVRKLTKPRWPCRATPVESSLVCS